MFTMSTIVVYPVSMPLLGAQELNVCIKFMRNPVYNGLNDKLTMPSIELIGWLNLL